MYLLPVIEYTPVEEKEDEKHENDPMETTKKHVTLRSKSVLTQFKLKVFQTF